VNIPLIDLLNECEFDLPGIEFLGFTKVTSGGFVSSD
jgi:hypothetical protein